MQSGKLRERVAIQSKSVIRDGFGAEQISWVAVATVCANVRSTDGTEQVESSVDQVVATISHSVLIRYRAGLSPAMRLVWRGKALQILSIVESDNLQRQLILKCSEIVGDPL